MVSKAPHSFPSSKRLNFSKLTSGLWEEEGEDADHDWGSAHDEEGEEVSHAVQVSDGGGQEGAQSGQCGARAWQYNFKFKVDL